jgi:POT family proton-dependent oligopeptide transporter
MPVLLAAVARAALPHLTATLIGTVYAGLFAANLTAGWLARFYESRGAATFWAGNGAIATLGRAGRDCATPCADPA